MDQAEIQQMFRHFSEPLAFYAALGARKEAVESLARNLWAALLGGEELEAATWQQIEQSGGIDGSLLASVRACYDTEMKPRVSGEQLDSLRRHYGIER